MFNGRKHRHVSLNPHKILQGGFRISLILLCTYLIFNFARSPLSTSGGSAALAQFSMQGFGFVLDALTGAPIPGARISMGRTRFEASADGQYMINGMSEGIQRVVVSHANYVPSSITFTVFNFPGGGQAVHIPPAYLVPKQRASTIPMDGGSLSHNNCELRFSTGGFSASLTGFQAHPGTPAPPDSMPTTQRSQPPRDPALPPTRPRPLPNKPFPLAVFFAEFPQNQTATVQVPLALPSELVGAQLPLLRFNTMTALWDRAGDIMVTQQMPGMAQGSINQPGLYMVVTLARLDNQSIVPTAESKEMIVPLQENAFTFTIPVSFEITEANPLGMRTAAFWFYGWRESDNNPTGVVVNVPPSPFPKVLSHCPLTQVQACIQAGGSFRDIEISVDGCGSTVDYKDCLCCPPGTQPQVKITVSKANDEYGATIGVSPDETAKIKGELKGKADKRKEDIRIEGAGCK